jgi:hypothetical protein
MGGIKLWVIIDVPGMTSVIRSLIRTGMILGLGRLPVAAGNDCYTVMPGYQFRHAVCYFRHTRLSVSSCLAVGSVMPGSDRASLILGQGHQ